MSTPEARSDQLDRKIERVFGIKRNKFVEIAMGTAIIVMILAFSSMYLILRDLAHDNRKVLNDISLVLTTSCQSLEALKTTQRNLALATIKGDKALLKENPKGIPGVSVAAIQADIDAKQKAVNELTPRPC